MASIHRLRAALAIGELAKLGRTYDEITAALPQYKPRYIENVAAQYKIPLIGAHPGRIRVHRHPHSQLWICRRGDRVVVVHKLWTTALDAAIRLADADRRATGGTR